MPGKSSLHLGGADGLRGLACLAVLVSHAIGIGNPELAVYTRGLGRVGVWLFFCLSAFLLTHQLLHRGPGRSALADYAIGRVLRIYPLYVAAVLAHFWLGIGEIDTPGGVVAALTLRAGYDHFWTIPVEVLFYVLLPPMLGGLLVLKRRWGLMAVAAAVALATLALQVWWPYWAARPQHGEHLMWFLPVFLFGSLAALLQRRAPQPAWAQRAALPAGFCLLVLLPNRAVLHAALDLDLPAWAMQKHLFFGLVFSVILWAIVGRDVRAARLLDCLPLAIIGRWSYSIYLFHVLAMHAVARVLAPSVPLRPALLMGAAILLGAVVFGIAERPLLALRGCLQARMWGWLAPLPGARSLHNV